MNINVGDKLVAVNNLTGFFNIGDTINVTKIEKNLISFVFENNPSKDGHMDFNSCEKYFAKAEEPTKRGRFEITEEYITSIIENSDFEVYTVFDKCTVVSCKLPNGFIITESSACVSPENYDEELGANICLDKIADKVWELEAYRLQHELYEDKSACSCENCDGCHCNEEGLEEFDECLDTDLDCDDCEDFACPYNSNNHK